MTQSNGITALTRRLVLKLISVHIAEQNKRGKVLGAVGQF
jgi:hypothetical protein